MTTIDVTRVPMRGEWHREDDTGENRILSGLHAAGVDVPAGLRITDRYRYHKPGVTCVELRCGSVRAWFDAPTNAIPLDRVIAKLDAMRPKIAERQAKHAAMLAEYEAEAAETRREREYVGATDLVSLQSSGATYTLLLYRLTLDQARDIAAEVRRITGRT